ncbi:GGDEF domain-containing protein [Devosia rhodophyticola]|uniref:diguanylate cyclase n=1 Tax=Devosia rhodophyticola TaxID=3026423 RepID=A0ABY7YU77_9HYPH|nr:GGDEF domain-containing protein [Devosia rhodophyticola]WDR04923.1 GGDEF domain-containing protein [Devosia rhodophyticola]
MHQHKQRLSRQSWVRVLRITALISVFSVLFSVLATKLLMETFSQGINLQGTLVAIIMPLILGTPMLFFMSLKNEQLRALNKLLDLAATTDWLTGCLNRGTFTAQTTHRLAKSLVGPDGGALLLLDADGFKSINDRFGHNQGDEALRLFAQTIRASVRGSDLVGRVGGEEFCIYLDNANPATVDRIAERIRGAIAGLSFRPNGQPYQLSVSIGGACFMQTGDFDNLYRLADQRLYAAKNRGRDCVAIARAA